MTITCPKCGGIANVIEYGRGYISIHCGNLIYNSENPPKENDNGKDRPPQDGAVRLF